MEMLNLSLPATNRFATGYLAGAPEIQRFFHYRYQDSTDYEARLLELQNRTFMRKELAGCIEKYMERFPSSKEVKASLTKLTNQDSVVVIGGQQAGILTGPLYSIHKIISIIALARQKEAELNIPVVPVFWIAGEDHDFQEVNHIYLEKEGDVQKVVYPEKVLEKKMVSDITIDKEICIEWVEEIIEALGETNHTKELLAFMRTSISQSNTFVDFFAHIVMALFKDDGLLVIDSADSGLRSLEKEIFVSQIEQVTQITSCVKEVQHELADEGFHRSIDISDQAANLFYYDEQHKERILLEFDSVKQCFIGKNGELQFSRVELLQIASEFPDKLSNNVVTRPMTQELLFPTLAFIAGPGEIAYWAELKQAFERFSIKLPPIVPRLNITLLDRSVQTDLQELGLSLEDVLAKGTEKQQDDYLLSVKDPEFECIFQHTKEQLLENYRLIELRIDKGLSPLFEKNQANILKQIEFMEEKVSSMLMEKHDVVLKKFSRVNHKLHPLGAPQERILNALYYMNHYGISFLAELTNLSYTFDGSHKVIKI
ncbi:bacillithiol biosynthesis cysteine-adding enzyme BshC [Bacillus sp. V3B]|uniref:bacillithiol biosynthesis cysteine-adding enzyme BshC n=1 Tax=Bacillus sp. V3B TaxID=2804915 RepID=UPI00210E9EB0|nr:bacillithiol biosynthesis cysteine-adding enzyme BshC [Bacillus sp. V3B]MCQ6273992.1 bacillithiol biosynthesis cysteine-adding enzyme BshC [Bacillus sp. V3B]